MSIEKIKETKLQEQLRTFKKVAIAYSGGIDSTYLLKVALDTLGSSNVLAVVVNSELFSDEEFNKAIDLADNLGNRVIGIEMSELANPKIVANTPDSWYFSKKLLYQTIRSTAAKEGFETIIDGMIMDDNDDFRPGLKARDEEGVLSPLQLVNLYKNEIRHLAKDAGITNWNKVASCSIASRFPYGTPITQKAVTSIFACEKFLRELGFSMVRVRIHDDLARIEVPKAQLTQLLESENRISQFFKKNGFNYISVDIEGFKSGHMNDVLKNNIA